MKEKSFEIKEAGLKINFHNHAGISLEFKNKVYVIDPFERTTTKKPDFVFITHEHYDHFSPELLKGILRQETLLIVPRSLEKKAKALTNNVLAVNVGDNLFLKNAISFGVVEAYNVNKFRAPGQLFHPKGLGLGYVLDFDGFKVYHSGDTDIIPEMKNIECDLACLPVSGVYVMTLQEAKEAIIRILKPKYFLPIHFFNTKEAEIIKEFKDAKSRLLI
jgi:L-ascorbate metabolism protein UlaG (beta-lactamase superfamily)